MIRIGIVGYGNLGRGAEKAVKLNDDMELIGIFTRRDPSSIDSESKVYHMDEILNFVDEIDVCILCGGSATDLREQGPELSKYFNTVDSFDTHAKIPEYFEEIDETAKSGNRLSIISTGWDPGLFSINRLLAESILPVGETHTFWGKGVSQGHGDAVRRIAGVKNAVQYTIPNDEIIERIKDGEKLELTARDKHVRVCYVVPEDGADTALIEETIVTMPNYFAEYDTTVHFITEEEMINEHSGMPHGGRVIRIGQTSGEANQVYEFSLALESNPEFTSSINVAYARAVYKLNREGKTGAMTVFDIPFSYMSQMSSSEQRRLLL